MRYLLFVLLILMLPAVHAESVRYVRALNDIETFSSALEKYRSDTGSYPNEAIGLKALLSGVSSAEGADGDGYLRRVSKDPWGFDYEYRFPGTHNVDSFDIWSNGSDGKVGGYGFEADCGNWDESRRLCAEGHHVPSTLRETFKYVGIFAVMGALIGLPLYIAGLVLRRNSGNRLFVGYHLLVLVYITLIGPVIVLFFKLIM